MIRTQPGWVRRANVSSVLYRCPQFYLLGFEPPTTQSLCSGLPTVKVSLGSKVGAQKRNGCKHALKI